MADSPAKQGRSETESSASPGPAEAPPVPASPRVTATRRRRVGRRIPLGRLLLYYAVVVGVVAALSALLPVVRDAFVSPIVLPAVTEGTALTTGVEAMPSAPPPHEAPGRRALTTLLVILGALALMMPVAWVYMYTKRLRYDPSLVQSVIILPMVVAGILIIVKNSLALAFSLAGIVAAVRFRNTLKDPKDAVYIFLAIGTGIASGVQALDIALVVSVSFNLVVLLLWKYDFGSIYSSASAANAILSFGDRSLLVAQEPQARERLHGALEAEATELDADGALLVHAWSGSLAQHAVEASLAEAAKDWRLVAMEPGRAGLTTLQFVLKLKKKTSVVDLLGQLDDRWSAQVAAAEFVPFRPGAPAEE